MNELQSSYMNARTKIKAQGDVQPSRPVTPSSYLRRHDVEKWLQRQSKGPNETKAGQSSLALMDLVEKSVGGNNVVSKQNYIVGIYEIVVSFLQYFICCMRVNMVMGYISFFHLFNSVRDLVFLISQSAHVLLAINC